MDRWFHQRASFSVRSRPDGTATLHNPRAASLRLCVRPSSRVEILLGARCAFFLAPPLMILVVIPHESVTEQRLDGFGLPGAAVVRSI